MNTNPTKHFSRKKAVLLFVGVAMLTAVVSIFLQSGTRLMAGATTIITSSAGDPSSSTTDPVAVGLGSSFAVTGTPARLIIPSIGVDAAIQSVGLFWNGDGAMGIPTNFTDVAWYNGGPVPGMPGNAVIDGHLDGKNVKEAVFYRLGDLQPGDVVEVVDVHGTTSTFNVVRLAYYDYDATTTDIFEGDLTKARLNLITCAGDWIKAQGVYNKRVVVFTQLE